MMSNGETSRRQEEEIEYCEAFRSGYRIGYEDVPKVLPKTKKIVIGLQGNETDNEEITYQEVLMVLQNLRERGRLRFLRGRTRPITDTRVMLNEIMRDDSDDPDAYEDAREYIPDENTLTAEDIARAERAEKTRKLLRERAKAKNRIRVTRKEFYRMVEEAERAELRIRQMYALRLIMSRIPQRIIRPLLSLRKRLLLMFQF